MRVVVQSATGPLVFIVLLALGRTNRIRYTYDRELDRKDATFVS